MKGGFVSFDINAEGTALALGDGKRIRIVDPMSWKDRQTLNVGENRPGTVTFSPDGKRLVVAHEAKRIQTKLPDGRNRNSIEHNYPLSVWDLASGKSVWSATLEGYSPRFAYTPDGSRLAVLSHSLRGPTRLWVFDASTGKEAGRFELPKGGLQLAFDRTGKRLAVAFEDTTAAVYNLETVLQGGK